MTIIFVILALDECSNRSALDECCLNIRLSLGVELTLCQRLKVNLPSCQLMTKTKFYLDFMFMYLNIICSVTAKSVLYGLKVKQINIVIHFQFDYLLI